ncbi:restriction endonuclease subunit S [bacterium]|nr:restriction endonuclease subunit S [bacterium]
MLIVAIGASLGKVALTHERCSANQQITGIKFHSGIVPEYGFWWTRSLGSAFRAAAPQATLPIINQRRIGQFIISYPSQSEQRRIVACLDDLQSKVNALEKLQADTAAELDALSPPSSTKRSRGIIVHVNRYSCYWSGNHSCCCDRMVAQRAKFLVQVAARRSGGRISDHLYCYALAFYHFQRSSVNCTFVAFILHKIPA